MNSKLREGEFLCLVVYRSRVGGEWRQALDFQVHRRGGVSEAEVRRLYEIGAREGVPYLNSGGELVEWVCVAVLDVQGAVNWQCEDVEVLGAILHFDEEDWESLEG